MSPSESQLRAALHDGEGDGLDAGALIAHAAGVRRERRRRVYLAAGAAGVVAAIGVGAGLLSSNNGKPDNDTAVGAMTAPAQQRPVGPAHSSMPRRYATSTPGEMSQQAKGTASGRCPATAARYLLPGGGGSGQFGASEPLFTKKVTKILVCAYPAKASAAARALVLHAGDAANLAASFEYAPAAASRHSEPCPSGQSAPTGTIELLATDADGHPAKPVVITAGCPTSMATNGTAIRYLDSLPRNITRLLNTTSTKSPTR